MNVPLIDDLLDTLSGRPLHQLAEALHLPIDQTYSAIQTALPLLVSALSRNARETAGAEALHVALKDHHRGHAGDLIADSLADGASGAAVLPHVFGVREPLVAQAIGAVAAIGPDVAERLVRVLAPVVLAQVAKTLFGTPSMGASEASAGPEALRDLLQREEQLMHAREGFGSGLLSVLDDADEGDVDLSEFAGQAQPLSIVTAEMRSPRPLL